MNPRVLIVKNLAEHFHVGITHPEHLSRMEEAARLVDATTIGVEVEIKYSSYFPDIFRRYSLDARPIGALSPTELATLTEETTIQEEVLLPKLEATVELGVPKDIDAYWEFANQPVYHPKTLAEELYVLQHADLIPMDVKHSMHITIGGINKERTKDIYMLLMCLEMLGYTSKERLQSGIKKNKGVAWGKKGFGGIRFRSEDVKLGKEVAFEFRTLELPIRTTSVYDMLYTAWFLAECIRRPDLNHYWETVCDHVEEIAAKHLLDTSKNWGRAFDNISTWSHYVDVYPLIDRSKLETIIRDVVFSATSDPKNQYLSFNGYV